MEDYCTGVPDGNWGSVCRSHDMDYSKVRNARKEADIQFKLKLSEYSIIVSWIYYIGVRLFGRLFV